MHSSQRAELRRLVVFGIVGTVNTAVCYALFAALVELAGWNYNLALVADYAFGIVLGYALHRLATFADRKHVKQAFGKYTVTLIATFFANLALLDAMVRMQWLEPLTAQAVAMVAVTCLSYALQKHWVFRSHGEPAVQVFSQAVDSSLPKEMPAKAMSLKERPPKTASLKEMPPPRRAA